MSCIFCNIISKKDTNARILYEDEDIIVVFDKFPTAKTHILVLPRKHIPTARELTVEHIGLVEKMVEQGQKLMRETFNDNMTDMRCGFTWPPLNSVNHLHLHFVSPASTLSSFRKVMFWEKNLWFVTPQYVLKRLGKF